MCNSWSGQAQTPALVRVWTTWFVPSTMRAGVLGPTDSGGSGFAVLLSTSILFKAGGADGRGTWKRLPHIHVTVGSPVGKGKVACVLDVVPGAHTSCALLRIMLQK